MRKKKTNTTRIIVSEKQHSILQRVVEAVNKKEIDHVGKITLQVITAEIIAKGIDAYCEEKEIVIKRD